jgi:hypothetical protein
VSVVDLMSTCDVDCSVHVTDGERASRGADLKCFETDLMWSCNWRPRGAACVNRG